jgi:hypothetical protein
LISRLAATLGIALLFGGTAALAEEAYKSEAAARTCIDHRISELLADQSRDVTADPALQACSNDLRAELKAKGKTDCEASDYIGWVVAGANSKRYGVTGTAYKPNKAFIAGCQKKPAK